MLRAAFPLLFYLRVSKYEQSEQTRMFTQNKNVYSMQDYLLNIRLLTQYKIVYSMQDCLLNTSLLA